MNPHELWIGKVMAAGLIMLVVWGIISLATAKSEVARRIRVVVGIVVGLAVLSLLFFAYGPIGVVIVGAICGAIYWVAQGRGE